MTDVDATRIADLPPQSQAQANPNGLMHLGAIASHNIAQALALAPEAAATIETAIRDEINAMSSHFTLVFADIQTQYEVEVAKLKQEKDDFITAAKARETQAVAAFQKAVAGIKSDFVWLEANKVKVFVVGAALVALGALLAYVL